MIEEKKTLFSNTVSLYLMNIIRLALPFLTLPYLTRVLSTESYGLVVYTKAFLVYVQLVLDFGFLLTATKHIVEANGDYKKIGIITGNTIIEKIILGCFSSLLYLGAVLFTPILSQHFLFCLWYLISIIASIGVLDFLFRGLEKMHYIVLPYVVSKAFSTALIFMYVKSDMDLMYIPQFETMGNVLAAIISIIIMNRLGIHIRFGSFGVWIQDLRESGVYFLSNVATTVFGALTTIIAGWYLSIIHIAYWGLCMQCLAAAKAMYSPLSNSLYPYMLKSKNIQMLNRLNKYVTVPIVLTTVVVWNHAFGLMNILGGVKYIEAGKTLQILLPAFVASYYSMIYGWPVLGAIGKVKETTATTIFASCIQLVGILCLIFLNGFTIENLAVTCVISELFLMVSRFYLYIKFIQEFQK